MPPPKRTRVKVNEQGKKNVLPQSWRTWGHMFYSETALHPALAAADVHGYLRPKGRGRKLERGCPGREAWQGEDGMARQRQ